MTKMWAMYKRMINIVNTTYGGHFRKEGEKRRINKGRRRPQKQKQKPAADI